MEIGSLFGLAFAKKLSQFLWQMSFTFVIDERLACYLITELLVVTLLFTELQRLHPSNPPRLIAIPTYRYRLES